MSDFKGKLPQNTENSNDAREPYVPVNSINFTYCVDRMPTQRSNAQGIYLYGADNNYPYKVKQLGLRSNSLVTAQNTASRFLQGLGFPGATPEDVVNGTAVQINRNGATAFDLLRFCAREKVSINMAVHVNYNALGEAVEFTPIPYEFPRLKTRRKEDIFDQFIISNIWHTEFVYSHLGWGGPVIMNFNEWVNNKKIGINFQALELFAYNPDPVVVREQITISGGIENYPGQLFYVKDTEEVYPLAIFDSVLDDAQIEAEAKLLSLSNLQNGFAAAGILHHSTNQDGINEKNDFVAKLRNTKGAVNFGRLIAMGYLPGTPPQTRAAFEPIQQPNVDKLFTQQKEDSKKNIYEKYGQSEAINGRTSSGMFNAQTMQDSFDAYNAITAQSRQELEINLNTLFQNSIIDIPLPIKIEPLQYVSSNNNKTTEENGSNTD